MTLGERLKGLRKIAHITQTELAERSGVSRPVLSRVEHGHQDTITLEQARRIARVLGVSVDLLAGTGDKPDSPASEKL